MGDMASLDLLAGALLVSVVSLSLQIGLPFQDRSTTRTDSLHIGSGVHPLVRQGKPDRPDSEVI